MKHLRYNLREADECGKTGHAQTVMKQLGITYTHSTPQSIAGQWWFWNCDNIPSPMPEYLSELDVENPMAFVGYGLSEKEAKEITELGKS